jgi:hypothetical protein
MASEPARKVARRDLLKVAAGMTAAGALAAGIPALVLLPDSGRDGQAAPTQAQLDNQKMNGPLVAYVKDASRGEVAIMTGADEVVVHDPALVGRLLGAIGV